MMMMPRQAALLAEWMGGGRRLPACLVINKRRFDLIRLHYYITLVRVVWGE